MDFPARIVDLHTHLFNARYVPLASIIANAMDKDESRLANHVAKLLETLTGSSYPEPETFSPPALEDEAAMDEFHLERIWNIAAYELLGATGSLDSLTSELSALSDEPLSAPELHSLRACELVQIIEELSRVDYLAEGWSGALAPEYATPEQYEMFSEALTLKGFFGWAKGVLKKALRVVTKLMDAEAWGEKENYLEFFLTMLKSEEALLKKLFAGYGDGMPPLQVVHYMMDMQMAYALQKPPYYPFHPVQLERMQLLQRSKPCQVFGFAAFDPRREDWRPRAEDALAKGFVGFKFYPAMGYKPTANEPTYQDRIDAFFDFCVESDIAVFVHCTPQGFQTRHKLGANAHPKYWKEVLENPRWSDLRLCLGHAGGGRMHNGDLKSPGWMAESDAQWQYADNFARIVSELCTTYPRVYCEIGYITQLFDDDKREVFIANIERARAAAANAGRPYELLDKMAYGSDWHMPDMVDRTHAYLEVFRKVMNREAYREYLERFFWQNAYAYLKLPS